MIIFFLMGSLVFFAVCKLFHKAFIEDTTCTNKRSNCEVVSFTNEEPRKTRMDMFDTSVIYENTLSSTLRLYDVNYVNYINLHRKECGCLTNSAIKCVRDCILINPNGDFRIMTDGYIGIKRDSMETKVFCSMEHQNEWIKYIVIEPEAQKVFEAEQNLAIKEQLHKDVQARVEELRLTSNKQNENESKRFMNYDENSQLVAALLDFEMRNK